MSGLTPTDTVIYAIGDIHGRLDLLTALHETIAADAADRPARNKVVVYLGDYVSRGKDSHGVVERVCNWLPNGFVRITLKGNHEDLLLRFLGGELEAGAHWFDYGGRDTLFGYGVKVAHQTHSDTQLAELRNRFASALPRSHLDFFESLQISYRAGGYCFVHAGIRPGVPLAEQRDQDRMWIRSSFLESDADHGAVVVHGHCISDEPEIRRNRIGIDTGAYRSGVLTCLVLDGETRSFLQTTSN